MLPERRAQGPQLIQRRGPAYTGERPVNTLLVSTFSPKHGGAISESLGPEAVAGHLQGVHGKKVSVDHVDLQLDPHIPELAARIAQDPPEILGISVKIGALDQTKKLMDEVRAIPFPDGRRPLVVMGSVVPTFATIDMLQRYPEVIMSAKEGENAAAGLVDYVRGERELDQVPGIWYMNDEGTDAVSTPASRLDLANRHLPARITTERVFKELGGMIWAEGSRGCDFSCTFCSIRDLHGGGFDGAISPTSVVDDLGRLNGMGITSVSFTDDDFGGDPERTSEIARLIKERGIDMTFSISTRADHIWQERGMQGERLGPAELAKRNGRLREIMVELKDAGLERVFIGMESGSPSQLKRYGKQVTVDGNYKALEVLDEIGIDVVAGYIPIDPAMNITELRENLEFLRRTGMYKKITNPLSVLRVQEGSPYLKLAKNKGLVAEKTDDLVFYDAAFEDPRVQRVAEVADRWVDDMYVLMFGLKGEVASQTLLLGPGGKETAASRAVTGALHNFRELEMSFIEEVTGRLEANANADVSRVEQSFVARREQLVGGVVELVDSGIIGKNPRLQEAVFSYTHNKK